MRRRNRGYEQWRRQKENIWKVKIMKEHCKVQNIITPVAGMENVYVKHKRSACYTGFKITSI